MKIKNILPSFSVNFVDMFALHSYLWMTDPLQVKASTRTQRIGFLLRQKKQAPSFKRSAQPWLGRTGNGQPTQHLSNCHWPSAETMCEWGTSPETSLHPGYRAIFSWAIIVALCTHYLQAWSSLLGMRSTGDKADACWCNCTKQWHIAVLQNHCVMEGTGETFIIRK